MVRYTLLAATCCLSFCLIFPSHAAEPTLADIAKQAIESNPEVQAKWHAFLASEQDVNAAKAGYKPTVDVGSGYGYHRQDYGPNREYSGAYAELTLNQMLYDGAKTRSEVKHFSRAKLVSYFELLDTVENTALATTNAYIDVLRQRELVLLAEGNLNKHVTVFRQIEESSRAGVARAADLEQINGRLSLAESNLLVEIANLHDVSARYLRIVNRTPPAALAVVNFTNNMLKPDIQNTLYQAYQTNPSFHATLHNILASEHSVDTQDANFKPQLNLTARYGVQDYDDLGNKNDQAEGRVGIEVRYNIYNGGRDSAMKKRALEEVNIAKDLRDKVCVDLRQTLQIAFNDSRKLSEQLPVLNQHRLSSDKVRTAYKDQFDIGQRSLLDVLDSENEYFQASRAYSNAFHDLNLAIARTLAGMGKLLTNINVVRDGLPTLADLGAEPIIVDPASACPAYDLNTSIASLQDDDNDGVPNYRDYCPNTPAGARVDAHGCSVETTAAKAEQPQAEVKVELMLLFEHNSDAIPEKDYAEIARLAEYLKKHPNTRVEIQGHTSSVGKEWYNKQLSERRAQSAADILVNNYGIERSRITAVGYAAQYPRVAGDSDAAHAQNRRTEAKLTQ